MADDDTVDYTRDIEPLLVKHCVACHGADAQESGLRLDSVKLALEGGYTGAAIVPGKREESLLYLAISGGGDLTPMPYEEPPLADEQIEMIGRWIDEGAKHPEPTVPTAADAQITSDHWAFQPIARPAVPEVAHDDSVRSPIDAFVIRNLEREGLSPSPEADRYTLIRRLSLDLLGLPPSWQEVERFVADTSPEAYERLVDRLLVSPHYGERWARHWLDAARYADSNGYTIDGPRSIWKYRDWVIDALNDDLPFDEFTIHQLAGDLLPEATRPQIIATGFHRNTLINQEGGTDEEQFRVEAVVDRVSTTGAVFLGLTIGCARCHDHKFDPITQRDFYELFAFFNNCDEPEIELPTPAEEQRKRQLLAEIKQVNQQLATRDSELAENLTAWEAALDDETRAKLSDEARQVLEVAAAERGAEQTKLLLDAAKSLDAERKAIAAEIDALKKQMPTPVRTMVFRRRAEPRATHIMIRGDFLRPGKQVSPDAPAVLPALSLADSSAERTRLDLARWIVHPNNPLTPRVTVNRIWQHYFGRGLVETENDFGTQGEPPTHPELLDWLAGWFVDHDWKLKELHRLIVCSATYRQSSRFVEPLGERDPYNKLLARQTRLRLEAEAIRDAALRVSGLLASRIGGPSVYPHQPPGVMELAQVKRPWEVSPGADRHRRTMYTYFWRSTPHPLLKLFDAPDANVTCTRRARSNTPLQSLTLLNDAEFFGFATALGERVVREAPASAAQRIDYVFQTCLSRPPTKFEALRISQLLDELESDAENEQSAEQDRWATVARVVLNLDEFITRQ